MDGRRAGHRTPRASVALAALACCLLTAPVAAAGQAAAHARIGYARLVHACAPPVAGSASCFAVARQPVSAAAAAAAGSGDVHAYVIGDGAATSGPAGGLTPAELSSAYGYEPATGGSGQTVAIVDAYDDPRIEADLAAFDSNYGLGACTTASGCFRKVNQEGSENPAFLPAPDETGWSQETSLDVETVRAACRSCKILLVEANNAKYVNLAKAVNTAVALGATEVSNSYGGPEVGMGAEQRAAYNHPGVVIAAATGDYGYDDWNYYLLGFEFSELPNMPNAPASLPSVVSVGGTTLALNEGAKRVSERVWNDDGPFDERERGAGYVATSGCSTLFVAQPFQLAVAGFAATGCGSARLAGDVSADADPLTGFDIYDDFNFCGCKAGKEAIELHGGWQTFGGTSLSAPMITALYALAGGGKGVTYPALTLYGHLGDPAALYDVTQGGNGLCDAEPKAVCGEPNRITGATLDCEGTSACDARSGYDGPTGVGTPNSLSLFEPPLPTAAISAPAKLRPGVAAGFSGAASSDPYPAGSISSYSWAWGDGTKSGGASPSHAFPAPGPYLVTLTVTDNYGLTSAAATHAVNVSTPAEIAAEEAGALPPPPSPARAVAGFQTGLTPPVPDAQLASTSLQVSSSGAVTLKVSCPAAESSCAGTVTLRTLAAVIAGSGQAARRKAAVLTLAASPFTVAGGKVVAVVLHLSARARALLARSKVLRARATIVAHDPAGATHSRQTLVTLRPAKAKHRKG